MKHCIKLTILTLVVCIFFTTSCKTVDNLSKDERIAINDTKISDIKYTFVPSSVILSNGMKTRYLDGSYSLKVTKDTISAFLPYFGRAYTAPNPTDEGGIKFTSTDYEYKTSEKNKGMWKVSIQTKDTPQKYKLSLTIGETGYTTLIVQENNRQSISFYGTIE